ncbi:MAG: Na+/H+ antiporter NhaA [Desulfomonile sp.]
MKWGFLHKRLFLAGDNIGDWIGRPFITFVSVEAAGGIMMILMTAAAMVITNSQFFELYSRILHIKLSVGFDSAIFTRSVHFWINEGLMTCFFLVVGLEIKRETLVGELASVKQAILPAAGALGGVLVPALIYWYFNKGTASESGWGVPMATDIAFVLGALTMLSSRVPSSLTIFLVSLAIVDDLVAVVIIAVFYSQAISFFYLSMATIVIVALVVMNILGVRNPAPYIVVGIVLWAFVYASGVHATVAGVIIALTIPARSARDTHGFADDAKQLIEAFRNQRSRDYLIHLREENQMVIRQLENMFRQIEPPLQRLEYVLHPWVIFGIMPIFALANAGVILNSVFLANAATSNQSLGIMLGLFVGKQVGIFSATYLAVKLGIAKLPESVTMKHVYGGAVLCGIGFTMSLFIAELSFTQHTDLLNEAKVSILAGSLLSGLIGTTILYLIGQKENGEEDKTTMNK